MVGVVAGAVLAREALSAGIVCPALSADGALAGSCCMACKVAIRASRWVGFCNAAIALAICVGLAGAAAGGATGAAGGAATGEGEAGVRKEAKGDAAWLKLGSARINIRAGAKKRFIPGRQTASARICQPFGG